MATQNSPLSVNKAIISHKRGSTLITTATFLLFTSRLFEPLRSLENVVVVRAAMQALTSLELVGSRLPPKMKLSAWGFRSVAASRGSVQHRGRFAAATITDDHR